MCTYYHCAITKKKKQYVRSKTKMSLMRDFNEIKGFFFVLKQKPMPFICVYAVMRAFVCNYFQLLMMKLMRQ